jgi:HK97 gp10 family phage protein
MANLSVAKLQAFFAALPPAMRADLVAATADEASRLARAMTYAAGRVSGNLRDSIRVEQGRRPSRFLVRAGGPKTTRGGYDYALANEFGTQKMSAQPFFWPTYRAEKKRIRRNLNAAIRKALAARAPIK